MFRKLLPTFCFGVALLSGQPQQEQAPPQEPILELLPDTPIDPMLFPRGEPHSPHGGRGAELAAATISVDPGFTVLPGRAFEKRDPTGRYAFAWGMATDKSGNKAVFYSSSTQVAGKTKTIRKMLPLDDLSDQPARYAAEASQTPGFKSLSSFFGDIGGWVVEMIGKACQATEDFVKALSKFRPYAPGWLQPTIDAIVQHAPPSWTGKEITKILMPGGANLSTQRLVAEIVVAYGKDYAARDLALENIAASHLIVTGQASNSPNPPYTAEMALMLELTAGMDITKDPRWAPALAAAINAQLR